MSIRKRKFHIHALHIPIVLKQNRNIIISDRSVGTPLSSPYGFILNNSYHPIVLAAGVAF